MGFTNSQLHLLSQADYNQQLFNSIGGSEGLETKVRNIGDGVATIGYGYTFNSHNNNYATFVAAGIVLTSTQADAIRHIDDMVRAGNSNASITSYALQNLSSLTMTKSMGLALFTQSVSEYDNSYIRNNFALSKERIALINISYNTPARIGPTRAPLLINAMKTGDRIATWYYLRFPEDGLAIVDAKYKVGILNRHFDAATSFGYLDNDFNLSSNIGKNYIKYMYRFLEERQTSSIQYVNNILNAVTNDSSFHGEIGVGAEIDVAKQILISEFSMGTTIDGKVIVGNGIGNTSEKYADKTVGSDSLTGTAKNDLIFGERGDDYIEGAGGSDVAYGGDGKDTLIGGDGMDILDGGTGNDTLLGYYGFGQDDSEQDKLYGGIGDDTYITGTGDIIRDDDNVGRVVYKNLDLSGTKNQVKGESYYEDANFYYQENGNLLYVRTKSSTSGLGLEIQNWNSTTKEALGIKLIPSEEEGVGGEDDPEEPNPNPDPTDPKYVTISVSNAQAVESAGTISFVVSLSDVLSEDVSIDFITQDGTANTGSDYIQYGNYGVTIPAGQRSAVYQVVVLNNEDPEPTENFTLTPYSLSYSGSENVLLSNSATGTIYDDDDPQYITAHISDASAKEATEHMSFTVSLSKELERDITITTSLGPVTIKAGERSGEVYSTWKNDDIVEPDVTFEVTMTGHNYQGGQYQVLLVNTATGTIIDDDPEPEPQPNPEPGHPFTPTPFDPPRRDPLVLDLNHDGAISTVSLADSTAFFDLTGDGIKEKVGWIQASEGIVVIDKNGNGKIDGISEVFGTATTSGFAELRTLADSNYDNVIDRRDELYNQLKVWQDTNQDGISQASELKTLSQAGVKNIELNVIGTNINLNGNILSEAGRYGDSAGDRELAADIQLLATERVNSSTTADTYTIDPITETLPQMRGYGYIDNSFKAYNLDSKIQRKVA